MKMKKKWGYEVGRRGLHKLWSVVRLNGLDDGSEDLVVFPSFFLFFFLFPIFHFLLFLLYQTKFDRV